tara:strand:- start:347 stop:580 length:234 start_codon:yes stop_codon:yes gene_type:complete
MRSNGKKKWPLNQVVSKRSLISPQQGPTPYTIHIGRVLFIVVATAIQWLADEVVVADLIGLIARSQANLKKRLIMLL